MQVSNQDTYKYPHRSGRFDHLLHRFSRLGQWGHCSAECDERRSSPLQIEPAAGETKIPNRTGW